MADYDTERHMARGLAAADGGIPNAVNEPATPRSGHDEGHPPPPGPARRLRLPLSTAADVRRELARLYREGRAGSRDIADVSRLANVLGILGRMIETSDLEARLQKLEQSSATVT